MNPYEAPETEEQIVRHRPWYRFLDDIGMMALAGVFAFYMLWIIRSDKSPQKALAEIPTWGQTALGLISLVALLVVIVALVADRRRSIIARSLSAGLSIVTLALILAVSSWFGWQVSL
jgi:hypothetical protein